MWLKSRISWKVREWGSGRLSSSGSETSLAAKHSRCCRIARRGEALAQSIVGWPQQVMGSRQLSAGRRASWLAIPSFILCTSRWRARRRRASDAASWPLARNGGPRAHNEECDVSRMGSDQAMPSPRVRMANVSSYPLRKRGKEKKDIGVL